MSAELCSREDELLDALGRGYVGPELTEHVQSCASCSELHLLAGALLDDRQQAIAEAPVPAAGTVWWRMRMRHRREAEATARRSLFVGQAVTLTIAIAVLVSIFGADVASSVRQLAGTIHLSTKMLFILATFLLAAPLAGWMAIRGAK
jgi:predicted anti-sigma-YlaC factor YlaD